MEAQINLNSFSLRVLPYSRIVGQKTLKLGLELAFIAPRLGGVLISGHRGTGKSTTARAFSIMVSKSMPVTLPINATEDRVIGGWKIDALMNRKARPQPGLLEDANGKLLYIDEVNLLDDHIVNIILDVTSTGILTIQREGRNESKPIQFMLVGTMNPEEGNLRPQLLDRFGLMADISIEKDINIRSQILQTVLEFDAAIFELQQKKKSSWITQAYKDNNYCYQSLITAREKFADTTLSTDNKEVCIHIAMGFQSESHRGDYILALAARALAAREGMSAVTIEHIRTVAPLALQHRRQNFNQSWNKNDDDLLTRLISKYE
ncbi:AAA family ATPase [Herpetosiphon geysericola]|uniref:Magnesium chelatase n=1 Tax=Herpetosiphon geysericola TaxID=70996 RepID=A0A0P6YQX6_9CHLR|nr:AAA family ATPase [Herpetosiphon geysericola]KPL87572.1 magnesium chelatase [Herpetosiphon geysericola]